MRRAGICRPFSRFGLASALLIPQTRCGASATGAIGHESGSTLDANDHSHHGVNFMGTPPAVGSIMRSSMMTVLLLVPTAAFAGGRVGTGGGSSSGSGGGRLGQVSGGISGASHPSGSSSGSSDGTSTGNGSTTDVSTNDPKASVNDAYYDANGRLRVRYMVNSDAIVVHRVVRAPKPAADPAQVDAFIGVSDTYDSNTAASAAVAISDSKLRLVGEATRYWEDEPDGSRLALTTAALQLGAKLPTTGGVAAFLQVGVMYVNTKNDPMMDSSITGGSIGLHVEHPLIFDSALVGDARVVLFSHDIHAWEGRLAVRSHHLEAGVRILDFDVGPALFGPEVGLAF